LRWQRKIIRFQETKVLLFLARGITAFANRKNSKKFGKKEILVIYKLTKKSITLSLNNLLNPSTSISRATSEFGLGLKI